VPPDQADPAEVPKAERRQRAAAALAEAIADARARGDWPSASRSGSLAQGRSGPGPDDGLTSTGGALGSGRRVRRDDPQPLATAIGKLLSDQGWKEQAAVGSVFSNWEEFVGSDLAAHTRPEGFTEGELVIAADSTAWATQVRLLASMLVRRLNAELGDGTVKRVKVRGPSGPRQRGGWRVPGSRGHGDTYG
jgi:predicted nucleic acid-binding Zn ribbon protein